MKEKKFLTIICAFLLMTSCGGKANSTSEIGKSSALFGTFTKDMAIKKDRTDQEDNQLRIFNDITKAVNGHLYTSDIYPLNTVNGSLVCYSYEQSLKLNRDYTYSYVYQIKLTNSEQWGKDFARMEVEMKGMFDFVSLKEDTFQVTLENPESGSQKIFGSTITGEGSIFAWNLSTVASFTYSFQSKPETPLNRYVSGRTVQVVKNIDERSIEDDIYYFDILQDMGPYFDYTFRRNEA